MALTEKDFTPREWASITSVKAVPRKYVPLARKYPHIKQQVKMRAGQVYTLNGGPLELSWDHTYVNIGFRGEEVSVYAGDLKEALNRVIDGKYIRLGDISFRFVEKVLTPHIDNFTPNAKPREEIVLEVTVRGQRAFVVFDELMWWLRVT